MRKELIYTSVAAVILSLSGCAKPMNEGPNEAGKRFFEAWIQINWPEKQPSGLGIYVLSEPAAETSGKTVTDNGYAFVEYRCTGLDGNITDFTDSLTARQLGSYSSGAYYGPRPWPTMDGAISAGLQDAIVGMKVHDSKKVAIPSWLMTYSYYDNAEEYLKHSTDYSDAIYEFTVTDFTEDIIGWQIDSIGRFFANTSIRFTDGKSPSQVFNGMTAADSLKTEDGHEYGFYYAQVTPPVNDRTFPSDTTVYINYTGRLLNGKVFDTTIERVAKDNGIYDSSRAYTPVSINWAEEFADITMGTEDISVVSGFALTLWQMKAMEKGIGVFYSPLGYSYSGSGSSIPGYAPLIFEIEITEAPE